MAVRYLSSSTACSTNYTQHWSRAHCCALFRIEKLAGWSYQWRKARSCQQSIPFYASCKIR